MSIHVSNFLEALTFADEQDIDTAALRADAERIIADFLAAYGPFIAEEDEDEEEGSMAFELGTLVSGIEDYHKAPGWASLFAMSVQLRHWCDAQGLPQLSADEIHFEADLTPAQREWLSAFCERWDSIAEDC